jgi:peptidoglycan/xylan/chitin deacetylase (PgdA/CDA1 family)
MPSGSTDAELQEAILKALVQTYVRADVLLEELDRKFAEGVTVEQLVRTPKGERNPYVEFMSLRSLKEGMEESLKGKFANDYNGALESGFPRVHALDLFDQQVERMVSDHPGQEAVIRLALSGVRDQAREYKEAYLDRRAPGRPGEGTRDTVKLVREARKGILADAEGVMKHFRPSEGESGIQVERFIRKSGAVVSDELSKVFAPTDRLPAGSGLKIEPSTGPAGNITGSGFPKGTWALTYDDGPAKTTGAVLDNLKKHGIKATFFMLSQQIDSPKDFPEAALREVAEGHDVASHSYTHPQVPKLGVKDRAREIEGAVKVFAQVLGKRPDFFRLPYGAGVSIASIRADMLKSCLVHVFWNVDTLDWHDKDPDLIYQRSVKQVESLGRGVILFHDIHSQSVTASEMLMRYLKEKAARMVTLSEIVKELNGGQSWTCQTGW